MVNPSWTIDSIGVFVDYEMAAKYIKRLNEVYQPYQICFVLNGNGILKDNSLLNLTSRYDAESIGRVKGAYVDDAINVYIGKTLSGGAFGATSYYSNTIVVKESIMWYAGIHGVLLAHEVAHALGIMHTIGNSNDILDHPNGMGSDLDCEHVTRDVNDPNFNANLAGDYVVDTAADPGLIANTSHQYYNTNSNCVYFGNQVDCVGEPYQIDNALISNIMSYGGENCKQDFTFGQAQRMHYGIDNADPNDAPIKRALVNNDINRFDLSLRNSDLDFGFEPDTVSTTFWKSPDIWVRPTNDNSIYHDNPIYGIGPNYVKVRVVNRGCAPSDGVGKLKLYWTKAGTNLPKPVWDGSYVSFSGYPLGGLIGEIDLPVLESYEEHIFTFPWNVPNPDNYSGIDEPWHFCLLAKIESPNDIPVLPQEDNLYYHFLNSNNIALGNVTVMKNEQKSGIIHIGNFVETTNNVRLKLSNDNFLNTNIFNEAEVKFTFDDVLWNVWEGSGFTGNNFEFFGDQTIIVNENTEILLNNFPPLEYGKLNVKVNFLTDYYTENNEFGFNVEHWDDSTNVLTGGEYFDVIKNERDLFDADAYFTTNTLQAIPINEPATYNWYDTNGNLLHTGQNYMLNNTNGTFLLEVIATEDGFKDTKKVTANFSNSSLLYNIYPNPTTNYVQIQYNQLNCNSAYIMLVNINTNTTNNYILDTNNNNITINTNQLPNGLYRVVLVCDNNMVESHNLKIQ